MPRRSNENRKQTASPHQQRIRFLTGFFLFLIMAVTIGLFLLINHSSLAGH